MNLSLFLAHINALRRSPKKWIVAGWWRLLGKKVRARAQFAPLLAATPQAYQVWLRHEPIWALPPAGDAPALIIVVDAASEQSKTLRSLTDQQAVILAVGSSETPALQDVLDRVAAFEAPWLMHLRAGDRLAPTAVAEYRAALAATGSRIIYADDDLIDARGRRFAPHFKPAWNPDLHQHFDYLSGACLVRPTRQELAGLAGPLWFAALVDRMVHTEGCAEHIARILHHRRARPQPRPPAASRPLLSRCPKVSVIIPTRDRVDLLRTCIEGLRATAYPEIEVIVVDNGSCDPATIRFLKDLESPGHIVIRDDSEFNFSRLNNTAARVASGEMLLLLNNDIEMLDDAWLSIMVNQALRPEVGAVGAQLLYPDGRIQHAGVVVGLGGGAGHAHRLLHPDEPGYFRRHALPQFVSAVTAACLLVRRECFEAVGGLDEANFAVAFNDVDLCLRLNAQGWQSFYEPRARLIHHESVSRGFDKDPSGAARLARELAALQMRWHTNNFARQIDPYHHPCLSRYSEHFVLHL